MKEAGMVFYLEFLWHFKTASGLIISKNSSFVLDQVIENPYDQEGTHQTIERDEYRSRKAGENVLFLVIKAGYALTANANKECTLNTIN